MTFDDGCSPNPPSKMVHLTLLILPGESLELNRVDYILTTLVYLYQDPYKMCSIVHKNNVAQRV